MLDILPANANEGSIINGSKNVSQKETRKRGITAKKIEISQKGQKWFLRNVCWYENQNFSFVCQLMWPVVQSRTDRHTYILRKD